MEKNVNEEAEEMSIQHRELIEEESINVSDLPDEIKKEMRNFNAKLREYEESGDIDLYYELEQDDVSIADNIQTWLEDMESEDDEEEEYEIDENEEDEDEEESQSNNQNVSQIEQVIIQNIVNNKIQIDTLKSILGREPNYPEERIGKIKLRKDYLKTTYSLI
jgi:hypothetical protein